MDIQPNAIGAYQGLPLETKTQLALGQAAYTDLAGLNRIKQIGDRDQSAAIKELAKQFESIFLNLMLKTMRETNDVFAEGNWFNSSEMEFHQQMFDNQLALNLSQSGGVGLADAFYKQMLIQFDIDQAQQSESSTDIQKLETTFTHKTPFQESLSVGPTPDQLAANQQSFVKHLMPMARQVAPQLGVAPEVLVAQSALETGWGRHVVQDKQGQSSFNLFNIKADHGWQGEKVSVPTIEFRDGIAEREVGNFRSYQNFAESFSDYAQFIANEPRYQKAVAAADNPKDYIQALQDAGYATDPLYAKKVIHLLNSEILSNGSSNHELASKTNF